jgi:hypothetical protein
MRHIALSIFCVAFALLTGCARSRVTTEIRSGGAWNRTVALTGQEKKEGQMDMGGSVEDAFAAPTGAGWKSTTTTKDTDKTVTYEKLFAAGASSTGDLSVKGDEGKVSLTNEVSVKMIAPKRYEYRETLKWSGPPPKSIQPKPEDLAEIKAALPKALATDANVQAVAQKTAALAIPLLFGPSDPLLAIGLLHPDLAERRARQRIGVVVMKALEDQFGDKMTLAERRGVALKVIATSFSGAKPVKPDISAGPPSGNKGSGLTPLMFIVKSAGKVISSNGEVDDLTGEVYWALFPEGASLQPVTLTAIFEVN